MKYLTNDGNLISAQVSLQTLTGKTERTLEIALNGMSLFFTDEKGKTYFSKAASKMAIDAKAFRFIQKATEEFITKALTRQNKLALLSEMTN